MAINFFQEDIPFNLSDKYKTKKWLKNIAADEGFTIKTLNFIFCTDQYLHQINIEYLRHDTYTDIITFDNSEKERVIEGDIFISIERVRENAVHQKVSFTNELKRVMSHGVFHLCGINDKSTSDKKIMRNKEEQALLRFPDG